MLYINFVLENQALVYYKYYKKNVLLWKRLRGVGCYMEEAGGGRAGHVDQTGAKVQGLLHRRATHTHLDNNNISIHPHTPRQQQ